MGRTESDTTEATEHRRDMLGGEGLGEGSQRTRLEMTDSLILLMQLVIHHWLTSDYFVTE